MQLKESYYFATNICSRKSATTFGDLPDCYGFMLPDLVYILSSLFIMNITEMIGISLRIVLRCFHDLMFFVVLRNKEFLSPDFLFLSTATLTTLYISKCNIRLTCHVE